MAMSASKLSPAGLMQEKFDMQKAVDDLLAAGKGSRSVLGRMRCATSKLDAGDLSSCDVPPEELISKLEKADMDLVTASGGVKGAKAGAWADLKRGVTAAMSAVQQARQEGEDHLQALNMLLGKMARREKRVKHQVGYTKTRVHNRLVKGSFPKSLANFVSNDLDDARLLPPDSVAYNPTRFNPVAPALWSEVDESRADVPLADGGADGAEGAEGARGGRAVVPESATGKRVIAEVSAVLSKCSNLDEKQDALTKPLVEPASTHKGAMTRLECDPSALGELRVLGDLDCLDHKGASPWLIVAKHLQFRCGPSSVPLPGVGCIIRPLPSASELFVALGPISEILKSGIMLDDVAAFLAGASGAQCADASVKVVKLGPRTCLWVPFGWFAWLVATNGEGDGQGDDDAESKHVSKFVVVSIPKVPWAIMLDDPVWKAISGHSTKHLNKVAEKKAWTARSCFFAAFSEAVASASTRTS